MKRQAKKRNTRRKKSTFQWSKLIFLILIIGFLIVFINNISHFTSGNQIRNTSEENVTSSNVSWIDEQIIPVDGTSRRGEKLEAVNDIVIHYVGNPGTTAQNNHDYYTNADSVVSSHFLIGLEGEIIQCVPLDEKSSASNDRNKDTISIEVCHPDESGKFNDITYESLVKLTAWLLEQYDLTEDHIIRHYDITGKICPKYFVDHEDAWEQFKVDVAAYRSSNS